MRTAGEAPPDGKSGLRKFQGAGRVIPGFTEPGESALAQRRLERNPRPMYVSVAGN